MAVDVFSTGPGFRITVQEGSTVEGSINVRGGSVVNEGDQVRGGVTQAQLDRLQADFRKSIGALERSLVETDEELFNTLNQLEKSQQSQAVTLGYFHNRLNYQNELVNNRLTNLQNTYDYQNKILAAEFDKQIKHIEFQNEARELQFAQAQRALDFRYQVQQQQYATALAAAGVQAEQAEAQAKAAAEQARFGRRAADTQIATQQKQIESLQRQQGLLDERTGQIQEENRIEREQIALATRQAEQQRRAIEFRGQEEIAQRRAAAEFFGREETGFSAAITQASVAFGANLFQAVAAEERLDFEKDKAVIRAEARLTEHAVRKEGVSRAITGAKGSIKVLKIRRDAASSAARSAQKMAALVIKGISVRTSGIQALQDISTARYSQQKIDLQTNKRFQDKVSNFNKDFVTKINVLKKDNLQNNLEFQTKNILATHRYNTEVINYQSSMNALNYFSNKRVLERRARQLRTRKTALRTDLSRKVKTFNRIEEVNGNYQLGQNVKRLLPPERQKVLTQMRSRYAA